jgi:hypothetical protein
MLYRLNDLYMQQTDMPDVAEPGTALLAGYLKTIDCYAMASQLEVSLHLDPLDALPFARCVLLSRPALEVPFLSSNSSLFDPTCIHFPARKHTQQCQE